MTRALELHLIYALNLKWVPTFREVNNRFSSELGILYYDQNFKTFFGKFTLKKSIDFTEFCILYNDRCQTFQIVNGAIAAHTTIFCAT